VTYVEQQGMRMECAIRSGFHGFWPQNPGGGCKEEQTAHGDIEELASRLSYHMKGTVAVG
jgi:hypothetical protein